jgi:cytochrome c
MGMIIGGSAVSLIMKILGREKNDRSYLQFSQELIETVTVNKKTLFLLGLVPLFPIALIYDRILFELVLFKWYFWFLIFLAVFSGIICIFFYRETFTFKKDPPFFYIGIGLLGHLILVSAYFLFVIGTGVVFSPEKWPFLQKQIIFILSWNSMVKFFLLSALFIGITGGAILVFISSRARYVEMPGTDYGKFVHTLGVTLTFVATLAIPPFIVLNLVTLPDVTLSMEIFVISAAILLLSLSVCLILSAALLSERYEGKLGIPVFIIYVMIFLLVLLNDHSASGNAIQERIEFLKIRDAQLKAERVALREQPPGKGLAVETKGEEVFKKICSACHRFDSRLVGPPLNTVLPKYSGDVERLKAFIRNPVKVNPDYPPMPKQAIEEEEIEAVAPYLLGRVEGGVSSHLNPLPWRERARVKGGTLRRRY